MLKDKKYEGFSTLPIK